MWALTAILTGLLAGVIHVVSGPDHLAAVAPIAADSRERAWRAGLFWGIGHSSGTWILAVLAIAFREALPVDTVSSWSERIVGVVLIGVGLWALRRSLRNHVHVHEHTHDGSTHAHIHTHGHGHDPKVSAPSHQHHHGALGIGTLHGLAGTSHLLGILPALALPSRGAAVAYVIAFGIGSIVAMTGFAAIFGRVMRGRSVSGTFYRYTMRATSLAAMGLGVFWLASA